MSKSIREIITYFDKVERRDHNQFIARCPAHDDKRASLSIGLGNDGRILFNCFAGCSCDDILRATGLSIADIMPDRDTTPKTVTEKKHVATYEYRNLTRKLRYEWFEDGVKQKSFIWSHYDAKSKSWVKGRGNAPHVLYSAGTPSDTVFLLEGEKDCDNLAPAGYYCLSAENGASANTNGRKWFDEYNEELKGKDIRIIPDNDETGMTFAKSIADKLTGVAKTVKLFDLKTLVPDLMAKNDISDVMNTFDVTHLHEQTRELLNRLEEITPIWDKRTGQNEEKVSGDILNQLDTVEDRNGLAHVCCTADNYVRILRNDKRFDLLRYNVMRGYPEQVINGKRIQWTDTDDASARTYIEKNYGISNRQKYEDGIAVFLREREYHPVQDAINKITWDGEKRVERFLIDWLGCDDTPYNRECSRLLFAGGINRAYNAGCKFDDVIVLMGATGTGKSTLVQWLALEPDFYSSVKTISGQKGYEAIQGVWICELEELLAMTFNNRQGVKAEEQIKAFISTQSDFYRRPYDRRPMHNPRHCIFIGTTNRSEFLTDKTGNRRWYPVRCNGVASIIYEHEKLCKDYIRQCWAEMLEAYKIGDALARPTARTELLKEIKAQQTSVEMEDYREALIRDYVENKSRVCVREIWVDCIYADRIPPEQTQTDSRDITEILVHHLGWVRGNTARFPKYGQCKAFYNPRLTSRNGEMELIEDEITT